MKEIRHITGGIFYCRDSAEINGNDSLETMYWFESGVLRNRQQNIPPNRCLQGKEHKIKHIWFLANAKCDPTKTKRAWWQAQKRKEVENETIVQSTLKEMIKGGVAMK